MIDWSDVGVPVWVLLIERGLEAGSDVRLFWQRSDAEVATRRCLTEAWLDGPSPAAGIDAAIEQHNSDPNAGEHVFLGPVVIEGERSRCQLCGEPIMLEDPDDPDSWVHAEDANDSADHTAEFTPDPFPPTGHDIA